TGRTGPGLRCCHSYTLYFNLTARAIRAVQRKENISVYRKKKRLLSKTALKGRGRPISPRNQTDIFKNRPLPIGEIGPLYMSMADYPFFLIGRYLFSFLRLQILRRLRLLRMTKMPTTTWIDKQARAPDPSQISDLQTVMKTKNPDPPWKIRAGNLPFG
ncbi:MAG: hypothetical protein IJP81_01655, partial [Bacteroidales bacterium]|nr:hypothetical protein [Bacteroidales bacterium]